MKRSLFVTACLVLALSLMLTVSASAEVVLPGDSITINIPFSSTNPLVVLQVDYAISNGLELVSGSCSGGMSGSAGATKAVFISLSGVASGTITLSLKVKADAVGDQVVNVTSVMGGSLGETSKKSVGTAQTHTYTINSPDTWGPWTQTLAPTCTVAGSEERVSNLNNKETREIPALGHTWGAWVVTLAPTCTAKGSEIRTCSVDAVTEIREIPALGHTWGAWVVTLAPTCTAKGSETHTCSVDAVTETREIAALGHAWGAWVVVTPATCTAIGSETRTCPVDNVNETRDIPMLAHIEGPWEIVKSATKEEPGLRVKKCLVGGEILKQEAIPFSAVKNFYGNTASSQGFRFRDQMPKMTKEWNMFTPLDISQDGEQTIPLIASNMYYIGEVKVLVKEGNVTVNYEVLPKVKVKSEFLAIFANLAAVTSIKPEDLQDQAKTFGEPINIEKDLAGDTKVLLYVRNVVDYNDKIQGLEVFSNRHKNYVEVLETLNANMD